MSVGAVGSIRINLRWWLKQAAVFWTLEKRAVGWLIGPSAQWSPRIARQWSKRDMNSERFIKGAVNSGEGLRATRKVTAEGKRVTTHCVALTRRLYGS
jgi:hypothetical protein